MKALSDMEREFHIGVTLKEVGEIVKAAAEDGQECIEWLDPRRLQSQRSFTSERPWLEKLFSALRQQGYCEFSADKSLCSA